jgi:hypothetical protein
LLAFLAFGVWVALEPEAEGGGSLPPPTPPPPPPAANTEVNEGAAISAIESVASAANLVIFQLTMQTSSFPAQLSHDPTEPVNTGVLQNIPGRSFGKTKFIVTVPLSIA